MEIRYTDKTTKMVKGTVEPPPHGAEIERRIVELAPFKESPRIFG
jgi:hypothetical protein